LILRKTIKIAVTRCHISKLRCTKFDFGWGSLQCSPRPPRGLLKGPTSKEREGRGREGTEGRERREGKGGEETTQPPFLSHFKPCLRATLAVSE